MYSDLRPAVVVGGTTHSCLLLVWQVAVMWVFYAGRLLARWAARVSEYAADRAAADWGYGEQLAAPYAAVGDEQPAGRLERLLLEHPPMPRRIERLTRDG